MPKVAFITLGCKVNQYETEVIQGLFNHAGYEVVDFDTLADIYVINTCSVTHLGEKKSRQLIRRAIRHNPKATVVVTGCYAQLEPEEIAKLEGVHVVIGTQDRSNIVQIVEESIRENKKISQVSDIFKATDFEDIPLHYHNGRTRAFLKIQEGCNNFCTYCIIPYARGRIRSRSLESIKEETIKMVNAGFKEIVLTGIHLGAYGFEDNYKYSLFDAIKTVLEVEGVRRLRLGSLDSIEISDDIINLMATNHRLCRQLHLPLQAGHNETLRRMKRQYTTEEFYDLVVKIRNAIPEIAISTDVIVGFPGESEEMFKESLDFIKKVGFSKIHVFPYSKRRGTPAATYPDQVDENVKHQRVNDLQVLGNELSQAYFEKMLNTKVNILVESIDDGMVNGLTDTYVRVYAEGNSKLGEFCTISVNNLFKDGVKGNLLNS